MHILYLIICLSPKVETNHILQNKLHMSTTMDCLDFNLVCKKQVQVCIITSIFNNSTYYLKHGCDTYWRIKKIYNHSNEASPSHSSSMHLNTSFTPIFKLTQAKKNGALAKVTKKECIES